MAKTGEQRLSRRYNVGLAIKFRVSDGGTIPKWRVGSTRNMSTRGIIFQCGQPLPLNAPVEMVIDWPVRYDNRHPIRLRAAGCVVRSRGKQVAVRMTFCRMVIEKVETATSLPLLATFHSGV